MGKRQSKSSAKSLGLYIEQARSFYRSAQHAGPETAPLHYYYSFLALAKALIETKMPNLRDRPANKHHGLSRKAAPRGQASVYDQLEIRACDLGIFQDLYEAVTNEPWPMNKVSLVSVVQLLRYLVECGTECERAGIHGEFISLERLDLGRNDRSEKYWVQAQARARTTRHRTLSHTDFATAIGGSEAFVEMKGGEPNLISLHWARTRKSKLNLKGWEVAVDSLRSAPLYYYPRKEKCCFLIPFRADFMTEHAWPQICINYAVFFWLGSLVRYDPEALRDLKESRYWAVCETVLSESRVLLLTLFCWAIYDEMIDLESLA